MFSAKLYSLTSVPPNKQKIVYKGKTLKNDETFGKAKFKENGLVGLIGKAEGTAKDLSNIEKKVFIEDLTKEERAKYLKDKYGVSNPSNPSWLNLI